MNRILTLTAVALTACGSSETKPQEYVQTQTTNSTQVAVTPTGTIYLRVMDGSTNGPLAGATVKVLGSSSTGATDADGVFKLEKAVVASYYVFLVSKDGYTSLHTGGNSLSESTGGSPLADPVTNVTATLYKLDGEVRGQVFKPSGIPVAGATVLIDPRNSLGSEYEMAPMVATSAADGTFKFTGLPTRPDGLQFQVNALWFDDNGDGNADYATTTSYVSVFPGNIARVFLTYSNGLQRIVAGNILDGELPPAEDIQLTFSMPVLSTNLDTSRTFILTNVTRSTTIPVAATWTGTTQVAIKPAAFALREGDRYNLAVALTTGGQNTGTGANFATNLGFQLRAATVSPFTAQATGLVVTNNAPPTGKTVNDYDFNSTSFRVQWNGVAGAVNYFVYARDSQLNPNWVQVVGPIGFVGANTQRFSTVTTLPATFFTSGQGGAQYPLAFNNKVTFAVVGQDIYGNLAPLSAAPTQLVADNVVPTASSINLLSASPVDAINDTTSPTTIVLRLNYSEPLDPASPPTFSFPAGITAALVWDAYATGSYSGTLTLTIAPGSDATGGWSIRGGKDLAGNTLTGSEFNGSFGGRKELVQNGNFEDASGNCSLANWTGTNTGTMPTPSPTGANARTGGCSATIGTPLNTTPATGISRLTQDVSLPTLTNTTSYFEVRIRNGFAYSLGPVVPGSLSQVCRITDSTNTPTLHTFFNTVNQIDSLFQFSFTGNPALMGGTSVRVLCEVNNTGVNGVNGAIYLDDVSLSLVKQPVGGYYSF